MKKKIIIFFMILILSVPFMSQIAFATSEPGRIPTDTWLNYLNLKNFNIPFQCSYKDSYDNWVLRLTLEADNTQYWEYFCWNGTVKFNKNIVCNPENPNVGYIKLPNDITCKRYYIENGKWDYQLGNSYSSLYSNWSYNVLTDSESKIVDSKNNLYYSDDSLMFNATTKEWNIDINYGTPINEPNNGFFKAMIIQPTTGFKQSQINNVAVHCYFKIPHPDGVDWKQLKYSLTDGEGSTITKDKIEIVTQKQGYIEGYVDYTALLPWDITTNLTFKITDLYKKEWTDSTSATCFQGWKDENNDGKDDRAGDDFFARSTTGNITDDNGNFNANYFTKAFDFIRATFTIFPPEVTALLSITIIGIISLAVVRLVLH